MAAPAFRATGLWDVDEVTLKAGPPHKWRVNVVGRSSSLERPSSCGKALSAYFCNIEIVSRNATHTRTTSVKPPDPMIITNKEKDL